MLIVVNYHTLDLKETSLRIINKLCENEKNVFIDISEKIGFFKKAVPSLEFAMLKNVFDTEIPALEKNAVINGKVLNTILENLDGFQRDFLKKQMETLGTVTANVLKEDEENEDNGPFSFNFYPHKEFFVDFEKKLVPIAKKIEDSPLYKVLKGINVYGYYLGSCNIDCPPTKVIVLSGSPGQKISYEEYANHTLKTIPLSEIEEKEIIHPEQNSSERYAYVRQHHAAELLAKKLERKNN